MNANAHVDLVGCLLLGIVRTELCLNPLGALHSVNDRGEIDQKAITRRFDDVPLMGGDSLLNDLVMGFQEAQRTGFVATHLAAETHNIGEHNGGQLARFCCSHQAVPSFVEASIPKFALSYHMAQGALPCGEASLLVPSLFTGKGQDRGLPQLSLCHTPPHPVPLLQGEREPVPLRLWL